MPRLYDPKRSDGAEPDPRLPDRASCDFHPVKQAVDLLPIAEAEADFYLCRECFTSRREVIARTTRPPHPMAERRAPLG